jgi:hypothetical protein
VGGRQNQGGQRTFTLEIGGLPGREWPGGDVQSPLKCVRWRRGAVVRSRDGAGAGCGVWQQGQR